MDVIVQSEFIITPYYDGIIKDTNQPFWYEYQFNNYTPYDFFVLTTRLTPYIEKTNTVQFDSNRYTGAMRYFINFSNGYNLVPLNKDEAQKYQTIVNDILKIYPRHVTLLHTNQTFLTKRFIKPLSNRWVTTV